MTLIDIAELNLDISRHRKVIGRLASRLVSRVCNDKNAVIYAIHSFIFLLLFILYMYLYLLFHSMLLNHVLIYLFLVLSCLVIKSLNALNIG